MKGRDEVVAPCQSAVFLNHVSETDLSCSALSERSWLGLALARALTPISEMDQEILIPLLSVIIDANGNDGDD